MAMYSQQWAAIRKLERRLLLIFLGGLFLPLLLLPFAPSHPINSSIVGVVAPVYLAVWGAGTLYCRAKVGNFRCPRCRMSFDENARVPRKICAHCGLPRYGES
jgi:hypothetical protein